MSDHQIRACEVLDIPLGAVVTNKAGHIYVFIGWLISTQGLCPYFVASVNGLQTGFQQRIHYCAAFADTVLKQFPELEKYRVSHGPKT